MTWARSLPRPVRQVAGALVHGARAVVTDLGAVGPDDPLAQGFGGFGAGSVLTFPQGAIFNERYIRIGEGTMIGPHACLTAGMAPRQSMASDPVVRIGDRCVIGRGAHVIGHWSVDIGDDVQTGPYVYITDQNHSYADPHRPVGTQWPVELAVRIGPGSWLGAHAIVLPGADIGRNVVVAAGAVVRGHVPDHCVVAGVPARIVRRWRPDAGWVDGGWVEEPKEGLGSPADVATDLATVERSDRETGAGGGQATGDLGRLAGRG
ncbi:MAG: acyltransferase [Acidimicrobiales bacterium]